MYSTSDLSRHILDEIVYLNSALQGKSFEDFVGDETLRRAVARSIEIIGEAVKKIPDDVKVQHPEINWREVAGMRDKLIHHYFGIDYQLVWDAIHDQLPTLQATINQIIQEEQ